MSAENIIENLSKKRKNSPSPMETSEEETQSIESNDLSNSKKRKRKTISRDKKREEPRKDDKRESEIKEKLDELDRIESAVKDGTHTEYNSSLVEIQERRNKRLMVAKTKRSLAEGTVFSLFKSQKDSAYLQFYWDKLALRRSMIENVQRKLNKLEQEYHSSSTEDEHLSDWTPPERPSTISSLTLGLTKEEAENDLLLAAK